MDEYNICEEYKKSSLKYFFIAMLVLDIFAMLIYLVNAKAGELIGILGNCILMSAWMLWSFIDVLSYM